MLIMFKLKDIAKHVELKAEDLRTRVQFPPPPPNYHIIFSMINITKPYVSITEPYLFILITIIAFMFYIRVKLNLKKQK